MATAKKKTPAKKAPAKKASSSNKPKPKEPPKPPDRPRASTIPPLPGKGASPRNPRAMTTAQLDARLSAMQRDAKGSRLDSYTPRSSGRGLGGISGGRGNSGSGSGMRGFGGGGLRSHGK